MSDYQTVGLIAGIVLLTAVGARYFLGRPSKQVRRDAVYWAIIIAVIAVCWALYALVFQ